jgi:hypothetical protein
MPSQSVEKKKEAVLGEVSWGKIKPTRPYNFGAGCTCSPKAIKILPMEGKQEAEETQQCVAL